MTNQATKPPHFSCPSCHTLNTRTAKHCQACAHDLSSYYQCTRANCQHQQVAAEFCARCGSPLTGPLSGKSLHKGDLRYDVREWLGGGGMGDVYRCIEHNTQQAQAPREVAIKLNKKASLPILRERFRQEVHTLTKLTHPNSVRIFGYGEHKENGILSAQYMVMEYLRGITLEEYLQQREQGLPQALALQIFHQIAEALAEAHEKQIIHRDLKPSNIMLLPNDADPSTFQAKLYDFGLAKDASLASPNLSSSGHIIGTLWYMSPEQARAEALDARSDIFSLGVILYQMRTGRLPFPAKNLFQLYQLHPQGPRALPASLPQRLKLVLQGCLAHHPEARFSDLRTCLQQFTQDDPLLPTEATSPAPIPNSDFSWAALPEMPQPPSRGSLFFSPLVLGFLTLMTCSLSMAGFFYWRAQNALLQAQQPSLNISREATVNEADAHTPKTTPPPRLSITRARPTPLPATHPKQARQKKKPERRVFAKRRRLLRKHRPIRRITPPKPRDTHVRFVLTPRCSALQLWMPKQKLPQSLIRPTAKLKAGKYRLRCTTPRLKLRRELAFQVLGTQQTQTVTHRWKAIRIKLLLRPWANPSLDGFPLKRCQLGCAIRVWAGQSRLLLRRPTHSLKHLKHAATLRAHRADKQGMVAVYRRTLHFQRANTTLTIQWDR